MLTLLITVSVGTALLCWGFDNSFMGAVLAIAVIVTVVVVAEAHRART